MGALKILLPLEPGPLFHPRGLKITPSGAKITLRGAKIVPRGPKITPRGAKITLRGAKIAPRGPKKASRTAKMSIFIQKTDVAKNIEKRKENQRFWLLQPAQGRPQKAPSPAKMTQDRSKMAPRPAKTNP